MGQTVASKVYYGLAEYLESLRATGQDYVNLDGFVTTFCINQSPRSPKCRVYIKNAFVKFRDLDLAPQTTKASKVIIDIGEATLTCDELGYSCNISGMIQLYELSVTMSVDSIYGTDYVYKVKDIETKATVKQIKSEVVFLVNGVDHSRFFNALLTVEKSDLASSYLNAALLLQKNNIKDFLNSKLRHVK